MNRERNTLVREAILAELQRQHDEPRADWRGVTAFYDDEVQHGYVEGEPDWDAVVAAVLDVIDREGVGG